VVDGGLLSNFPIALFDGPGMDERPTFGLRLTGKPQATQYHARCILTYTMAMFLTATGAADAYYLEAHNFLRTIEIDNQGISPVRFDLAPDEKERLYRAGQAAAESFLDTWDFAEWRAAYARWAGQPRRAIMRAALGD
jgi:NTE family protein